MFSSAKLRVCRNVKRERVIRFLWPSREWTRYDNHSHFLRIMHFPCPRPARRKKISNLTTSHRASIRLCLCKEKVTQRFISVSLPSNTFDRTDRTSRIRESGETYILFFIHTLEQTNDRAIGWFTRSHWWYRSHCFRLYRFLLWKLRLPIEKAISESANHFCSLRTKRLRRLGFSSAALRFVVLSFVETVD